MIKTMEPGVYFNMSFADYMADPSLSGSGVKDLLVAPETYYERSSMNPDRKPKDTEALAYGSAYHSRILEGREAFDAEYSIIPDKEDYPNAIDGGQALKNKCAELELPKTGKVADLADRIAEADPSAEIWLHIMRDFEVVNAGKTLIKKEWGDMVERRAQLLESIPAVAKAITGGYPEVSIFWHDPKTGVPLKARIDYLKTRAQIDLKSFANPTGKPINTAIAHAVANYRYYVQAAVHSEAVSQAKILMRDGQFSAKISHKIDDKWTDAFINSPPHSFIFLFLEKAEVPCIRLKEFSRFVAQSGSGSKTSTLAWESGQACFRHGVAVWAEFMERFGPDKPWIDVPPLNSFEDEEFPLYMFND